MGHGNSEKTQYNQSLTTAQTVSPYEQRRAAWDNDILDAANSGDYRTPPKSARVLFNLFDPSERKRRRELEMGAGAQGTAALGAASPTALALDRQNRNDEDAEDAAQGYQQTWSNLVGGALADEGDLSKLDQDRRLGVLGTTSSVYNTKQQQPKWWQTLMGGAMQAGSALLGNPAAVHFAKGGRTTPHVGQPAVAGEVGPELEVDDDGTRRLRGVDGPEAFTPDRPGTIIPADETRAMMSGESGGSLPEFLRYRKSVPPDSAGKSLPEGGAPQPSPTWVRKLAAAAAGAALAPQAVQTAASDASADGAQPPAVRPRRALQPSPDEARAVVQRRSMPDPNAPVDVEASPVMGAAPSPRPTLPPAAVDPPGLDTETTAARPRWVDPIAEETEHGAALHEQAAHPQKSSRLKALALMAARGFIAGGPGGAIVGAAAGALDPSLPNAMKYGARAAQSDERLSALRSRRRDDLGAAQVQAQTDYLHARPEIEGRKIDASALKQSQAMLAHEIGNRLKEPRPFDPSDAYDSDLAARAQAAGVRFAPGAFGDFKNPATLEVLDQSDPTGTHKTRLVYDRDGGGWRQLDADGRPVQTNYVQPVGADGMTAGTRGSLALGGRRADETQRHDLVTESQGGERIGIARGHLTLAQAAQDSRFDEQSRKRFDGANKLAALAEEYEATASTLNSHDTYIDPDTHEQKTSARRDIERDKFLAKAATARRELFTSYRDAFKTDEQGHVLMTEGEFKALFPTLAAKSRAGADARLGEALRLGINLTDGPGAQPDASNYTPSAIHRPAPRAHTAAAPHSQARAGEDSTVRAYADEHFHGNYAEALRKANADRAAKGLPPIR
ncbi:MAG: hypothetical protein ACJ74Q_21450 [Pyrinomonadaceae bacterium]